MTRHSATLAVNERLQAKRNAGEEVLHLGFGEAGLPVPPGAAEVLARSAGHNAYGPVAGSERARRAAAGFFDRRGLPTDPDRVLFAPGSKALLFGLLAALPGGVVLPQPSWVSYAAQAALLHERIHWVPVPAEAGGVPDPDLLERALVRAEADGQRPSSLVLTLPDNPTGTLAPPDLVRRVCAVAERHDLLVISDEIYRDLATGELRSPAELLPERTVVTCGLSKSTALGGYRIGFARLPTGELGARLHEELLGIASEIWSGLAAPMQDVAAWVLDDPAEVTEHIAASSRLHRAVAGAVHAEFRTAGAVCREPTAAFYLYPDLEPLRPALAARGADTGPAVAELLLDRHGVGVLAGAEFGDPEHALRFRVATSLLYGETPEQRRQALHSRDPLALPWIRGSLDNLRAALRDVAG
ncbi:pyridoxal phosphate-dependent aminotransferase [Saccharopolyspora sp. HNM0983]|uniref:Aminotransferase n=1 Tax=Saccharopolyspora montiporae TaxID=2781240 RepID=A0A929BA73_9PSEU|nr:pyridoxal phosphate-dependent aminotransferase [Saccharopolyspora sp. HNM0983]MBE9374291.1 pyridoxal phosphate-dependent aminotransferase [Saccharopolyspora sp. HNM0983]